MTEQEQVPHEHWLQLNYALQFGQLMLIYENNIGKMNKWTNQNTET